jgi:transposase
MGYRVIARDVKIAAVRLYERELLDLEDILDCCGFSRRTWFRIWGLWRETGDVVPEKKSLRGRVRDLDQEDRDYLLELIRDNPDYFLDELLYLLATNRFISVHFTTIYRELERLNVSRKKLKKIALERNEERRADFIARMAQYDPNELGFLDK